MRAVSVFLPTAPPGKGAFPVAGSATVMGPRTGKGRRAASAEGAGLALALLAGCGAAARPAASSGAAYTQKTVTGQVGAAYASTPPPHRRAPDVLRGASRWPGAKRAALDVGAMWTSSDLSIGATVDQDHAHSNPCTGGNVWKGDSLGLYCTKGVGATAAAGGRPRPAGSRRPARPATTASRLSR